jgi:hypothetical protein
MKVKMNDVIARSELCDAATQVYGWFSYSWCGVKDLFELGLLRHSRPAMRGAFLAMTAFIFWVGVVIG